MLDANDMQAVLEVVGAAASARTPPEDVTTFLVRTALESSAPFRRLVRQGLRAKVQALVALEESEQAQVIQAQAQVREQRERIAALMDRETSASD